MKSKKSAACRKSQNGFFDKLTPRRFSGGAYGVFSTIPVSPVGAQSISHSRRVPVAASISNSYSVQPTRYSPS